MCSYRHPRRSPFEALKFLLVFDESAEFWAELLKMGGAASTCNHEVDSNSPGKFNSLMSLACFRLLYKHSCNAKKHDENANIHLLCVSQWGSVARVLGVLVVLKM